MLAINAAISFGEHQCQYLDSGELFRFSPEATVNGEKMLTLCVLLLHPKQRFLKETKCCYIIRFLRKPQFRTITATRLATRTVHTSPTRLGGYSACVRSRLPTTASPRTTPLTTARGLVVEHAPADLRTRVQSSPTRHEHRVRQRGPGSQKPTDDGLVARAKTPVFT